MGKDLASRFAGIGMISIGWWDNGIRQITNSKRPIKGPADLKGLKIRTPPDPMTIDMFQALGAATEQISFGELYIALQQGVVDGQENPLDKYLDSKLHEVNRFICMSAHKWECSPFLASQITWARLGADRRQDYRRGERIDDLQRKLFIDTRRSSCGVQGESEDRHQPRRQARISRGRPQKWSITWRRSRSAISSDAWLQRVWRVMAQDIVSHGNGRSGSRSSISSILPVARSPGGSSCRRQPDPHAADRQCRRALRARHPAAFVSRKSCPNGSSRFIMAGVALAVQKGGHMAVETVLAMLGRQRGSASCCWSATPSSSSSYVVLGVEIFGLAEIMSIDCSPVLGLP